MKIAIIGAGPTGIFTARFLKDTDHEIHLFEKNKDIGEKLKITGGGRMNVTNKRLTHNEFFSHDDRRKKYFFKNPATKNLPDLFEELGVEYFWEKNRAILSSQNAKAEVARLKENIEHQKNCTLHLSTKITDILPQPDGNIALQINGKETVFERVIVTTGAMFQMGQQPNKEDTYGMFERLGHSIQKPSPSLSPFRFQEAPFRGLSGISVEAKLSDGQSTITDDLLLTHFGLSGPAVLDFSALWNPKKQISLGFIYQLSPEEMKEKITELRTGKHELKKFLGEYLPKRLSNFLLEKVGILEKKYVADINKQEEKLLIKLCTAFPLPTPQLFPYPGCWTTKGGISLSEIHMHSLESTIVPNLYFGGELIDIDGLCGGYHISLAAACGKIMAESVV